MSTNKTQDLKLIDGVIRGDQKSCTAIYNKYKSTLTNLVYRRVSPNFYNDIDDIVVGAFARIFKNIRQYQPTYAFSTWICTVTRNYAIDWVRRESSRISTTTIDRFFDNGDDESFKLDFQIEDPQLRPDQTLETHDRVQFARKLLAPKSGYTKSIRAGLIVAKLRWLDELKYDEISEKTGHPEGTIKAYLNRFKENCLDQVKQKDLEKIF